ncbi:MAG: nucleotidyltransferase substrate binding protein [Balneolales bacterium]|nr:nucleotidyltransferase substrate binding protein [Balneolales bacterium]
MNSSDIRWQQRLANLDKALKQLADDVQTASERELSRLERQGIIQSFEYTHELAWNVMKDYFQYQGNSEIRGSRDATREAFRYELIEDGKSWMDMIQSRNLTSHTYNEDVATEIAEKTVDVYFNLFQKFYDKMVSLKDE